MAESAATAGWSPAGLQRDIGARLRDFRRVAAPGTGLTAAAVAVCVVFRDGVPGLLITRRAPRLRSHAGQWALPGGRQDPGELAPEAARRELREETSLEAPPDAVLGLLDDYVTRSGYLMTPVVIWGGPVGAWLARRRRWPRST